MECQENHGMGRSACPEKRRLRSFISGLPTGSRETLIKLQSQIL